MKAPIRQRSVGVRATRRRNSTNDSDRPAAGAALAREVLPLRRAAAWFDEQILERDAQQNTQAPEDDERQAPAVVLADQAGEKAAADRPDVDARLMQPIRASASPGRDSRR